MMLVNGWMYKIISDGDKWDEENKSEAVICKKKGIDMAGADFI